MSADNNVNVNVNVSIDYLIDMLQDYRDMELTTWALMYMRDELLNVTEKLTQEGITEGHQYEEIMLVIKQGEDLPQPFTKMTMERPLSNEKYFMHIKEITQLRYNKNGDLIVQVLAKREKQNNAI